MISVISMPSYKLHYFDLRGYGEVSRILLHLGGVEFEDHRITQEEWPELKPKTPFGHIPVLEVDGKFIPQSFAIARYLAKEFGFAGKSPFEAAWVDALGDQFKDYHLEMRPFFMGITSEHKDKLLKEIAEPARDKFFGIIDKIFKDNGNNGHLVGDSLTWVDIVIADHIQSLEKWLPGFFDSFPTAIALRDSVFTIPKVKEWIEKRPDNPY